MMKDDEMGEIYTMRGGNEKFKYKISRNLYRKERLGNWSVARSRPVEYNTKSDIKYRA
jgi:hypothetical protein